LNEEDTGWLLQSLVYKLNIIKFHLKVQKIFKLSIHANNSPLYLPMVFLKMGLSLSTTTE